MKDIILIWIWFTLLLLAVPSYGQLKDKEISASQGILDLRDHDFDKNPAIKLNGEWAFYFNAFVNPHLSISTDTVIPTTYFNIPNSWTKYKSENMEFPVFGFASYRLKVLLPKKNMYVALKVLSVSSAATFFVNGDTVMKVGKPAESKNKHLPKFSPGIEGFYTHDSVLNITIHCSNFSTLRKSGIWDTIYLGNSSYLRNNRLYYLLIESFLIGGILIMGLYFIGLFLIRSKDKSSLYFGLFSIFMSARIAFTGEYLIGLFFDIPWHVVIRVEYLTFYVGTPMFAIYIHEVFPDLFKKQIFNILIVLTIIFGLFVLLFPAEIYTGSLSVFQIMATFSCFYILYIVGKGVLKKSKSAILLFFGFTVLFAALINDILYQNGYIHSYNVVSAGIFFFMLIQAIIISGKFSMAFTQSEFLSEELNNMNSSLEEKVKERTLRLNKKTAELENRSQQLELQHDLLEQQQKEIEQSIIYAKRIQTALFPNESIFNTCFSESFVLWRPRSIVSGDFYWAEKSDGLFAFAVADSTGHGVPGAFMSILGISFLNEVFKTTENRHTDIIFELIRSKIKTALGQTGRENEPHDGMDMAFCILNIKTMELEFSGALHSLHLFRNNELHLFKGNRNPLGIYFAEQPFKRHTIKLEPGDVFYLFSDGFADQSGGSSGKKYKILRFRKLLQLIHLKPLADQQMILKTELNSWMLPGYEQVDDILVLGLKV